MVASFVETFEMHQYATSVLSIFVGAHAGSQGCMRTAQEASSLMPGDDDGDDERQIHKAISIQILKHAA